MRMTTQQKKSFAVYQQMLKSALTCITKYSKNSRRSFLLLVEDNTGLHRYGTRNLVQKFMSTKDCFTCGTLSWEESARADTKELNSEDLDDFE